MCRRDTARDGRPERGHPAGKRVEFRVGINLGDVIAEGDDIFGDGVNVAARLEALAEPGGVLVSSTVYEHARDRLPLSFEDRGEHQVKNIARPVRVYRVRDAAVPVAPPLASPEPLPLPDKPSLVVLPFQNMTGDAEQDYFVDGVVEELTTAISRLPWLFVIARNSAFIYKGRAVDVRQVARELGVRYGLRAASGRPPIACGSPASLSTQPPARTSGRTGSTAHWMTYSNCRTRSRAVS
jgi:adenylate cyclase